MVPKEVTRAGSWASGPYADKPWEAFASASQPRTLTIDPDHAGNLENEGTSSLKRQRPRVRRVRFQGLDDLDEEQNKQQVNSTLAKDKQWDTPKLKLAQNEQLVNPKPATNAQNVTSMPALEEETNSFTAGTDNPPPGESSKNPITLAQARDRLQVRRDKGTLREQQESSHGAPVEEARARCEVGLHEHRRKEGPERPSAAVGQQKDYCEKKLDPAGTCKRSQGTAQPAGMQQSQSLRRGSHSLRRGAQALGKGVKALAWGAGYRASKSRPKESGAPGLGTTPAHGQPLHTREFGETKWASLSEDVLVDSGHCNTPWDSSCVSVGPCSNNFGDMESSSTVAAAKGDMKNLPEYLDWTSALTRCQASPMSSGVPGSTMHTRGSQSSHDDRPQLAGRCGVQSLERSWLEG